MKKVCMVILWLVCSVALAERKKVLVANAVVHGITKLAVLQQDGMSLRHLLL